MTVVSVPPASESLASIEDIARRLRRLLRDDPDPDRDHSDVERLFHKIDEALWETALCFERRFRT